MIGSRRIGVAVVAFAAALWGLDALFRRPLAHSTGVSTIVFGEHVVLVVFVLPFVVPALRAVLRLGWRALAAAVVVGAGASAVATILFTQAFVDGDPVTPVVLQKVQPVVAVVAARFLLGERMRPRFGLFLVTALAGTWLVAFKDPIHISAHGSVVPSLYALGAAVLWALGTVLGRYLSRDLAFEHVTTLRFVFGLPAAAIAVAILGQRFHASAHDSLWIALLALVTGVIALFLYYWGLKRTPATAATLAELAFPVTAALVGYIAFHQAMTVWQWVGVGLTSFVVVLLPGRRARTSVAVPGEPSPALATG